MIDVNEQAKEKLKFYGKTVLAIFLIILIAVIALKIYHELKRPANANYVPNAPIPVGWDPTTITDTLFNVIDGAFTLNSTKDDAYAKFNALNDNEMIAVYNDWNKRYSTKTNWGSMFGSLTQAVKDETGYAAITGVNNMDVMIANLDRLKLP